MVRVVCNLILTHTAAPILQLAPLEASRVSW